MTADRWTALAATRSSRALMSRYLWCRAFVSALLLASPVLASSPAAAQRPVALLVDPPADNVHPVASSSANCPDGWYAGHSAIDCFAPLGTPLLAVETGTIGEVRLPNGTYSCENEEGPGKGGNAVFLKGTASQFQYYYGHLDLVNVTPGQAVQKGDVIGTLGASGNAGCGERHLHFEIRLPPPPGTSEPGDYVNPFPFLGDENGTWARTDLPAVTPTVSGSLSGFTNFAEDTGAAVGTASASGYNGKLTVRLVKNDVVDSRTFQVQANNPAGYSGVWFDTYNVRKVCVEAYANATWVSFGCKGIVSGTVTTMTGTDGTGNISGTVAVWGWSGGVGVRVFGSPMSYSTPGTQAFTTSFSGQPAGGLVCVQANSYGMWTTIGCRGIASGRLDALNWASGAGTATGPVHVANFSNPLAVRLYVNGTYAGFAYSTPGGTGRTYSIPFNAPQGAQVCTKADAWGHLQTLGCKAAGS